MLSVAAVAACVGFNIRSSSECADLCDTAGKCGFLPSSLGWANDGDPAVARDDCVRRCENSPVDDPTVATILSCFDKSKTDDRPISPWCEQNASDDAGYWDEWEPCARFSDCLNRNIDSQFVLGDVDLTVQLMSAADYAEHLAFPASDWPPEPGSIDVQQSCQPALCAQRICQELECSLAGCDGSETSAADTSTEASSGDVQCEEVCELPEGVICDGALCRIGALSISTYCDEMGVEQINVLVYTRQGKPASEVFQDVNSDINADCADSSIRLESDSFRLSPGPLTVVAQVTGELLGADLKAIGYFDFPNTQGVSVDDAASTSYCIEMLGPAMTVRAGESTAVVPLADLAALEAGAVVWRPCS